MIKPDTTTTKEFKVVPEGTHLARCYQIIHIGHVPNTYPGAENPTVDKIRISWELPTNLEVFKEGEEARPYSISQEYTLSMHEKANLYKSICQWLGKKLSEDEAKEYDVEQLIGQTCMLNIVHKTSAKGNVFALVNGIMQLPKGIAIPEPINTPKVVNWDNITTDQFSKLPPFIQDAMKSSTEYKSWGKTDGADYPVNDLEEPPF